MNEIKNQMAHTLETAEYCPSDHALDRIITTWDKNKNAVRTLLSRHTKWDDDLQAVVLDAGWTRPTDPIQVGRFFTWLQSGNASIDFSRVRDCATRIVDDTKDGSATTTDEMADALNGIVAEHCPDIRYRFSAGMKVSRAVGKLCHMIGADNDTAYNRQFAQFGDASSAIKVQRPTILSVHPCDYLTMSYGTTWRSCHDIRDKEDAGCYSAGTLSYMLDSTSIVCYSLRTADDIGNYTHGVKLQRNMIHVADGGRVVVQGRVYPQENDGAADLYAEWRHIVQDVLAECMGVPSMWDVKKGTEACKAVIEEGRGAKHYPDYNYYENCNVSRLKGVYTDGVTVEVGHVAICPECGDTHTDEENVCCPSCRNKYVSWCEECEEGITEYDFYNDAFTIDGRAFCCCECANRAGYMWMDDVDDWRHEDDLYIDDYTGEYFADDSEMVRTEDGRTFRNYENAECAGYVQTTGGEWYEEDEVFYCDVCGDVHHVNALTEYDGEEMCENCAYDKINDALHDVLDASYNRMAIDFYVSRYHILAGNADASYFNATINQNMDVRVTMDGVHVVGYRADGVASRLPYTSRTADNFELTDDQKMWIRFYAGAYPAGDMHYDVVITVQLLDGGRAQLARVA